MLAAFCAGCERPPQRLVVYSALDQEFSKPLFDAFTRSTGVEVEARYDVESTKTVGLVQAIIAESERPRCDLFWNNEALHTLRLERLGLLRPYASAHAQEYPKRYRSGESLWYGFAARGRVLLVNTNLVPESRRPRSVEDLTDIQWYDQVGIAKPLFGTTATHAACLWATLGEQRARDFFERVKKNCKIVGGNKQVAQAVAGGSLAFGLTDTDDAMVEVESGAPVTIVYPDQQEGGMGTLFIPNTLCLPKGAANPGAAQQLLDFLLSAEREDRLAMGASAQIPLNKNSKQPPRVKSPSEIRAMEVDFYQAAAQWEAASTYLTETFSAAE